MVRQQDLELEALVAAFPDNVEARFRQLSGVRSIDCANCEAATGSFAPAPRSLEAHGMGRSMLSSFRRP